LQLACAIADQEAVQLLLAKGVSPDGPKDNVIQLFRIDLHQTKQKIFHLNPKALHKANDDSIAHRRKMQ
jgi:hypothetical protein